MSKLSFVIMGLPKSMNGSAGRSWKVAAGRRAQWRRKAKKAAIEEWMACRWPKKTLEVCKITCVRISSGRMDFDNLVASFKPIIDGLKDAGIIRDDTDDVIQRREYLCEPAAMKEGCIKVTVEEIK